MLHESLKTSPTIEAISDHAECVFLRLTITVDDFGRYHGALPALYAGCYPVGKKDVTLATFSLAVRELQDADLIRFYQVAGRTYLYLPTWAKFQRMRNKESKFPDPVPILAVSVDSEGSRQSAAIRRESPPSAAGVGVGVGVGNGGGGGVCEPTAAPPPACVVPGCTPTEPDAAALSLPPPAYEPPPPVAECQDCFGLLQMLADGGVYFASPGPALLARVHAAHSGCGMDLAKSAVRKQLDTLRGGLRRCLSPRVLFDPDKWEVSVNAVKGAPRLVVERI